MKKIARPIIKFATPYTVTKEEIAYPVIAAYQCRNGLAVGHVVKRDTDGDYTYMPGWVIYHVQTGCIVHRPNTRIRHATPAAAMRYIKAPFKGTLLAKLRKHGATEPHSTEGMPPVIGNLAKWPRSAPPAGKLPKGCEAINPAKYAPSNASPRFALGSSKAAAPLPMRHYPRQSSKKKSAPILTKPLP
ncbi:MAG: hypothetical protein NTX56_12785 [Proteobacteria bacterium]|nr:hypothetical protein [Pseudomonadota bacterium]